MAIEFEVIDTAEERASIEAWAEMLGEEIVELAKAEVPTEPGEYIDGAGQSWWVTEDGHIVDGRGQSRPLEFNWILVVLAQVNPQYVFTKVS